MRGLAFRGFSRRTRTGRRARLTRRRFSPSALRLERGTGRGGWPSGASPDRAGKRVSRRPVIRRTTRRARNLSRTPFLFIASQEVTRSSFTPIGIVHRYFFPVFFSFSLSLLSLFSGSFLSSRRFSRDVRCFATQRLQNTIVDGHEFPVPQKIIGS